MVVGQKAMITHKEESLKEMKMSRSIQKSSIKMTGK